jgi:hypothetical protein
MQATWPPATSAPAPPSSTFYPTDLLTVASDWSSADTLVIESQMQTPLTMNGGNGQDFVMEKTEEDAGAAAARMFATVRRISLTVDQCDSNSLEDLLSCVKNLKGKVKLEIDV